MALPVLGFSALVQSSAAAVQGAARALLDFSVGSTLRAILEGNASVALWLQYLILRLATTVRAATSSGTDLDSWCADFGLARLPAVAAVGQVTFARYAPSVAALVPVGTQVRTLDGSQTFTVTTDTANAAWSASQGGYVLAINAASVTVPVRAAVGGVAGNVVAGAIASIVAALPGVDTVTNAAALEGGTDAEADGAFRARFAAYIASLRRGTLGAIGFGIASIHQGVSYTIIENEDIAAAFTPGHLVIVADDGTGTPSSAFLAKVETAVEAYRAASVRYTVVAPSVVTATIAAAISILPGYDGATVRAAVDDALTAQANAGGIGDDLAYFGLAQTALSVGGVAGLTTLTLNAGTANLVASAKQVVRAGTVTVT